MNLGNPESTDWLDAELRRVPLPDGLVTRLRQSAADSADGRASKGNAANENDDELDTRLRDVVLPASLLAGLRCAIADAQLDDRLAAVPVPSNLIASLRRAIEDAALDQQVADVPTPTGLLGRLRRAAAPGMLRRLAMAASLLIAAGLTYGFAMWIAGRGERNDVAENHAGDVAPVDPSTELAIGEFSGSIGELDLSGSLSQDDDAATDSPPAWLDVPALEVADADGLVFEGSVAEELTRAFSKREGRNDDPLATRWQSPDRIVGFTVQTEKSPSFQIVSPRRGAGIAPPLASGYDRTALARWGVHPFVQPARNDVLRVSVAPLWTATDSFDLLFDRLETRQRTNDVVIRPEDFLAAMRYEFRSAEAGRLALRTAAGPAPFSDTGVGLIQIGVQAGPLASVSRRPVHLTVAVDDSAAMRWHGRLAIVRESLRELIAGLGEDDRISIVSFSDRADVLVRDLGVSDAAVLRTAVGWLTGDGGANLAAGLRAACGTAIEAEAVSSARRCVVLISDSVGDVPNAELDAMTEMVGRATAKGVEFSLIELAPRKEPDRALRRLARDAGGRYRYAEGRGEIRRHLGEVVMGRPTVVARGAELRVVFNPQAVAEYRLVGHEPVGAAGWSADSATGTELDAGQTATALYQVVLHDNNVNDVATAEVIWRDVATGQIERVTQRISRLQFATSFLDSGSSLQAAALAAETAEVLRQSYFTPRGAHSLDRVTAMAMRANPRLREQPEFKRLLRLAEMAQQAGMDR
jgi:Ca-activated chloride channel family protein